MVLDTSAILAILLVEAEELQFLELIGSDASCLISAVSIFEAGMVLGGRIGPEAESIIHELIEAVDATVVSFDADQAALAHAAFRSFGKGRHPARLNLGDCAAYALSKATGEPLLFKGSDFALTDVARCL